MIDPQTGALAAGGVAPQFGPSMTQGAFNSEAVKHRDLTAAQMTPVQLSGAQDRAQRCINSNYKDFG